MTTIHSKVEIILAIRDSGQRAQEWFSAIPAEEYFHREGEVWSASDNVDHLIKAIKPVKKAMGFPKMVLQTRFGKPGNPSRQYEEICSIYEQAIAKGGKAGGSYLPVQETPEHPEEKKLELLGQLAETIAKLVSAVEKWDDAAFDECQLPHPLLGDLTLREILYFTIYHTLRHARLEGD